MWADVSGISKRSESGANLGSGERAGSDVVPVGTVLWSSRMGLGEPGSAPLENGSLRNGASSSQTDSGYETRAGLCRSQNQSGRSRSDQCEVCRRVAASGTLG